MEPNYNLDLYTTINWFNNITKYIIKMLTTKTLHYF